MYLHVPITEASAKLGISISVLKKRCRSFGIRRWPYRKIKSYEKKVTNLERNLLRNPEKSLEIATQIQRFSRKRQAAISHPEKITSNGIEVDMNGFELLENGVDIEDGNFFSKIHKYRNDCASISESSSPAEQISESPSSNDLSDVELLLSLSSGAHSNDSVKLSESNSESDEEMSGSEDQIVVLPPCSSFDLIPPAFIL